MLDRKGFTLPKYIVLHISVHIDRHTTDRDKHEGQDRPACTHLQAHRHPCKQPRCGWCFSRARGGLEVLDVRLLLLSGQASPKFSTGFQEHTNSASLLNFKAHCRLCAGQCWRLCTIHTDKLSHLQLHNWELVPGDAAPHFGPCPFPCLPLCQQHPPSSAFDLWEHSNPVLFSAGRNFRTEGDSLQFCISEVFPQNADVVWLFVSMT